MSRRYPGSIALADAGVTSLAGISKPLSVEELIAIALKLARAMASMHGRGVKHRDISPANIVIADNTTPCVLDFGLATSATRSGQISLTPPKSSEPSRIWRPSRLAAPAGRWTSG